MRPLFHSLGRTLVAGFVLLLAILLAAPLFSDQAFDPSMRWGMFVVRWLHVLAAVMWVGLLWYFNFVQIPSMAKIPDDQKGAVTKVIAPTALFWFRWAALFTVVTGLLFAWLNNYLVPALTLGPGVYGIGVGMWLGLIMACNVWFIIWPKQKMVLGMVQAGAEERLRASRAATLTSRVNMMLSIPMLYCMLGQSHGGF